MSHFVRDLQLAVPNSTSSTAKNSIQKFVENEYELLRSRAGKAMLSFPGAVTLQPTAVVNEAVLKVLSRASSDSCQSRCELMIAISRAMRDVLIDNFRQRMSLKRGAKRPEILDSENAFETPNSEIIDLKIALESLHESEPRRALAIEMQYFGGFSVMEIADALRVSKATVERDIAMARGKLFAILAS